MPTTFATLDARELATAIETIYTVPGATTARLTEWWIKNNSAANRTVIMHIVNSGGAAGDDNELFTETLAPNEYFIIPLNTYLDTGDFVRAYADGADVASRLSGMQRT